jgi:hypothetical protein
LLRTQFIGRLCIYKLILFNSNPELRLSADVIAEIDKLVLAGYRSSKNPMTSHLNFVLWRGSSVITRVVQLRVILFADT